MTSRTTGMDALGHPFEKNPQKTGPNVGGPTVKTPHVTITSNKDPEHKMMAVTWHGKKDMRIETRPKPKVTDPSDIVIRVTSTAICGSDLHFYTGYMPGMQSGDIVGHEFMGIVEEAGPEVKGLSVGDRVVSCFDISCGQCWFCKRGRYTSCDCTNISQDQERMYGHKTAGFFGYTHMCGGWEGGQAEFVRVPFADINCLKLPANLPDERVLFLSDILSTAWHTCEMGNVQEGDTVAIWGAGPVGILTAHCAQVRKASQVVLIDCVDYRLEHAKKHMPGIHTINFKQQKVKNALESLMPGGPEVCCDCVGMHYAKSLVQQIELMTMLETDSADILNEVIYCCRKGGRISVAGAYGGFTNHFNIGAFMEKGLGMRAGQTPVQKYWKDLLSKVQQGVLDPTMVITHVLPLDQAPRAYKLFNDKQEGCIKVVMKTPYAQRTQAPAGPSE